MLVMIDNYDSFTYNIVQYFGILGETVRVFRNDELDVAGIAALAPTRLVISPGPCTPTEAGISVAAVRELAGRIPILGICLGHQAIGAAFGGEVVRAGRVMHGKTSMVEHDGNGLFAGIANPFEATRYHSLVIGEETFPAVLRVIARARDDGEIMAIEHRVLPVWGIQFHPESILTTAGMAILDNFLRLTAA
ncbi:MAG: aminodeoxychorismate/anthranilate synthase component II [Deltaproteobacteria bacterium]|nr:aminodeoxychorismate/anthranilate synthase component II [Candidatus Anaeroferrophillacea bacterium]